ncbi:tail assembly chaperone [Lactiplantibacillus plantarum]|uniref:tail assembly chaperone n=1 Tax=Lactiplantibacillus plantarum TaxID=1590 RepID=UPI003097E8E1
MNINGKDYNFKFLFIKKIKKELTTDNTPGFQVLMQGLLTRDVEIIVKAVKALISQDKAVSDTEVLNELAPVFENDGKTDKLFDDFLSGMIQSGFLRQMTITFKKNLIKELEMYKNVSQNMNDKMEQQAIEENIKLQQQHISHLDKLMTRH